MGKYDHLKILKETKARAHHVCFNCGNDILPGETYYREYIEDKFLHSLHAKKYCSSCYEKIGNLIQIGRGLLAKPDIYKTLLLNIYYAY